MSCGVGGRHGSDLALLWLWCRPAAAVPIGPLAWEPSYAKGVALKKKKLFGEATKVNSGGQDTKRVIVRFPVTSQDKPATPSPRVGGGRRTEEEKFFG